MGDPIKELGDATPTKDINVAELAREDIPEEHRGKFDALVQRAGAEQLEDTFRGNRGSREKGPLARAAEAVLAAANVMGPLLEKGRKR